MKYGYAFYLASYLGLEFALFGTQDYAPALAASREGDQQCVFAAFLFAPRAI